MEHMKTLFDSNKEMLKMIGLLVVSCVSTTWILSHQIHTMKHEMYTEIGNVRKDMHAMEGRLTDRINSIDRRLTAVETVLIMQGAPLHAASRALEEKEPRTY